MSPLDECIYKGIAGAIGWKSQLRIGGDSAFRELHIDGINARWNVIPKAVENV